MFKNRIARNLLRVLPVALVAAGLLANGGAALADDKKDEASLVSRKWKQLFASGELEFNKDGTCTSAGGSPRQKTPGKWSVKDGTLRISGCLGDGSERTFQIKWADQDRLGFSLIESGKTPTSSYFGSTGFIGYEK